MNVNAAAPRAPLAILYLPPILNIHEDDELATLGRKLAASLDKFSADNDAVFTSQAATVTVREREEGVVRLTRRTGSSGTPTPLADLFLVDYRPVLMARYRGAGLPQKTLLAALGLVVMAWKGIWALVRQPFRVKRLRDRFQALYALGCFSLVFLYLALVLVTAAKLIAIKFTEPAHEAATPPVAETQAPSAPGPSGWLDFGDDWPPAPDALSPESRRWFMPPVPGQPLFPQATLPTPRTNGGAGASLWQLVPVDAETLTGESNGSSLLIGLIETLATPWQWLWDLDAADTGLLLLALTALGLAGGQGRENRLRQFINRASEEMLAFIYYLSFTDRRAEITGLVDARLEEIMESGRYERFQVMGYSFGTVVALDTFCPASETRARRLDRVDTLVTIAAPYDFILTYWPRYFADRLHSPPPVWLNVYSPVDLLGTCFDKDAARAEKQRRLRARKLSAPAPSPDEPQNSFGQAGQLATGPTREFAFREGIPDEQLGLFGWLAMQGLGSHSRYWAKGEEGERNCFDLLVGGLFPQEVALPANEGKPASGGG